MWAPGAGWLTGTLPEIPAAWVLIRNSSFIPWDRLKGLALAVTISWIASKLQRYGDKGARTQGLWLSGQGSEGRREMDASTLRVSGGLAGDKTECLRR